MEFDVYRPWAVREIAWCTFCHEREANGPEADFCALCTGAFEAFEAELLED